MKKQINNQWNQAHDYFSKNLKVIFWANTILFILFVLASTVFFKNNSELTTNLYMELINMFESQIPMDTQGFSLFSGIFLNNIQAGAISVLTGFIPFLFIPLWSLTSNALIIGIVGGVYQMNGYSILAFLVGILPHGVLEIPAFLLGITLGLEICYKLVLLILRRIHKEEMKQTIKNALTIYILWMVPLFFIAAIIETYITPIIFSVFL